MHSALQESIAQYIDPYLKKDLITLKAVKALEVEAEKVSLDIALNYPVGGGLKEEMSTALQAILMPLITPKKLELTIRSEIETHIARPGVQALQQVKNIIAVGSGKGGVGKSTVAVNIAFALAHLGASVGILDADIYGPSQTAMLGTTGMRPLVQNKTFVPLMTNGVYSISIGNLVAEETPMVWRGPMIGKAMQQLFMDTTWPALDYLIVDLPPGTGDIQLTLCQKIPVSGALIVTTPQDIALLDVKKACEMFLKMDVPLLGFVENMSSFNCPHCQASSPIFGVGGGEALAARYQALLLGQLPLEMTIREQTDSGKPFVLASSESVSAKILIEIARKLAVNLAMKRKDYSYRFPKITVEHTKKEQS